MLPWTVLIVDMHTEALGELIREFQDAGGTVTAVGTAAQAMAFALDNRVDVAVVSAELHDESGLIVLEHLRKEAASGPVIMVSAVDDAVARIEAFGRGCDDYLLRPVKPAEVVARATRHLEVHRTLLAARGEIHRLIDLAHLDELTQVGNLKAFEAQLAAEFARAQRYDDSLSVLLVHFGQFRNIYENFGAQAHVQTLSAVGASLKLVFRATDFLARIGDEQFAALLPKTHLGGALSIAERLQTQLGRLRPGPPGLTLKPTMGVSAFPGRGVSTAQHLLGAANQALRSAQVDGHNRIGLFQLSG